jgi:hypothetical protein
MKNLHHHIFSETTCISKETMLKFINKQLSQKELHEVQKHLLDCDFCSEALEGMQHAKNPSILFNIDHQITSRTQQKTTPFSRIILVAASLLLVVAGSYYTVTNFNDAAVKESELAYEEPVATEQTEEELLNIQTPVTSSVSSENKQETSNKNTNMQAQQNVESEQIQEFAMSDNMASGSSISQTYSSKERIATEVAEAEDAVADNMLFEEPAVATKKDTEKEVDLDASKSLAFSSDKKAEKPSKNKTRAKTTQAPSPATYTIEETVLEKKEVQTVVTDEEVNNRTENTSYTTTTTGGLTTAAASTVSEENHLAEGKASYENKDYITAIHHFDIILAKPKTTNETYEAKWFKALCFIGLNDNTTAKKLLNELVQVNNPFSKKAEEKLKVLK